MIFQEKKVEKGFEYKVEEAFGTLEIYTLEKLKPDKLDEVFTAIFEVTRKSKGGVIEGGVQGTDITYKFNKKSPWLKKKN